MSTAGNVPNRADSAKTGKKRARPTEGIPTELSEMAKNLGSFIENTNTTMVEVAHRIGYSHDLSQQRRLVNAELLKLPMSNSQRLMAASMIVKDEDKVDLFFSLDENNKMEWVSLLLEVTTREKVMEEVKGSDAEAEKDGGALKFNVNSDSADLKPVSLQGRITGPQDDPQWDAGQRKRGKMEQMNDHIRKLKLYLNWFQEVGEGHIKEKEKLCNTLESAERKCTEIDGYEKKWRYLVPADLTVGQFVYVVRKRIKLAALMSAIYEENKDEDGFLYMTYSVDEWTGEQKLQYNDVPEDIEPEEIRPMGNYVVSITWPDGFTPELDLFYFAE
ncbi:unnamed protein product [Camellia sinensis]